MTQYIDKSAVVAEIERILAELFNTLVGDNREFAAIIGAQHYELIKLAQYIDTLEVKEVGLEKENSKELADEIYALSKRYPEISFAKLSRIAVRVAKWQKEQDKKGE